MYKKHLFTLMMIICVLISSTGCTKVTSEVHDFQSVANSQSVSKALPEGVKVIENPEEFQETMLDQAYNRQTDDHYNLGIDTAADNKNIYIVENSMIHVLDKETKNYTYLCNKPECTHNGSECNAYLNMGIIRYYDGALYSIDTEYVADGEKITAEKQILYRIATDGSGRDRVCELATIFMDDTVPLFEGDGFNHDLYWTIHRGYIYYAYRIGTSGLKDDSFHNNMSNYLLRMKLDKNSEREFIMPFKGEALEMLSLKGYGSYVYFMDVDSDNLGELYRFQTESGEVEKMPFGRITPQTYLLSQDHIDYTKWKTEDADTGLYRYYFKENRTEKILDFREYDERFGTEYPIYLMQDNEYLYGYYWVDVEKNITNCKVFTYDGVYVSDFDVVAAGNYNAGLRLDEELVLMPVDSYKNGWFYFEKEELKTGDIHPVFIEGSVISEKRGS